MGVDISKVTSKAWGWSEAQVMTPLCETHRIDIRPGGYCSVHQHDRKHNVFTLVKGKLQVWLWAEGANLDGAPQTIIQLKDPGDTYDVAPGVVHQFYAPEYCMAIETYYPAIVKGEDIFRFNQLGGIEE